MKCMIHVLLLVAVTVGVTACGHKGKLKTPSQVEAEQQKKERKEAKQAAKESKKATPQEAAQSADEVTPATEQDSTASSTDISRSPPLPPAQE